MNADLIIHNIRQLVTCAPGGKPKRGAGMLDVGIIENGAVAVSEGRFVGVGKTNEILRDFQSDDMLDAQGQLVTPGFVDPHTHIVFAGDRLDEFEMKIRGADYLAILAAGEGIISTVRETRNASFGDLVESGLHRLDQMLACGTTTCEVKTGYGLDTETELKMLAVIQELDNRHSVDIIPTFLAAHAVPTEFKGNANAYIDLICRDVIQRAWRWYVASSFYGRAPFFCDVFCEKGAFSLELSRRLLETAKSLGFKLKAHVDEFTNLGGSKMAIGMGAISIDHLDAISDDEISLLAKSNTVGIVTPTVNFNFGRSEFANARKLIDAGCALAVSTDYNPGSAPCPSQPMAMAIACRYQKLLPAEVMNAATVNASHAIGLGASHGSIEVGKWADLILAKITDYREMAYDFGNTPPHRVMKRGAKQ